MSQWFFEFDIICPHCGNVSHSADGFATDDWTEWFAFSGYSEKSAKGTYNPYYQCPECGAKEKKDCLYRNGNIKTKEIDRIKSSLKEALGNFIDDKYWYCDHGWQPDLEAVVYRYGMLFPQDSEMQQIKREYLEVIWNRNAFLKFEPAPDVKRIGPDMIRRKSSLTRAYLPQGLKEIEAETFKECRNLEDVFVPDSVYEIGAGAFENSGLRKIHLPKILHSVSYSLFKGCYGLGKIFLSDEIETIGNSAFEGCERLYKLWLPDKLRTIGERAFYGCKALQEIYIPGRVEQIGRDAFAGCPDLLIKGVAGSTAENYARLNQIPFAEE